MIDRTKMYSFLHLYYFFLLDVACTIAVIAKKVNENRSQHIFGLLLKTDRY